MLKPLLLAGFAAAAFIPSLASAQESCRDAQHNERVAGTIVGAGVGALLGGAITGHTGGAVVGGVGGAVAGNAIAGSGSRCGENRYGYYDNSGQWVPTTSTANGYYDHDGQWVVRSNDGYRSAPGYSQSGYDRRDGYAPPPAREYGRDGAYTNRGDGHMNFSEREDRMDQRIRQGMMDGTLDHHEARQDLRELADIRRMQGDYRSGDGRMDPGQRADIDHRLDDLQSRLHMQDSQR